MKRYGLVERSNGFFVLAMAALAYLVLPRQVEKRLMASLNMRKQARVYLYGESE